MKIYKVYKLGMELERIEHKSCTADFGVGQSFATLYSIESKEEGKGHATELLIQAKIHYEAKGLDFGSSIALNDRMKYILQKLNIKEYAD